MKILHLKDIDILLTYSWCSKNHGICGHIFEVIDYYFVLKNHFKTKILIPEIINGFWDVIMDKYEFSEFELKDLKENIIFNQKPLFLSVNNIIFTDGSLTNIKNIKMSYKKRFLFACGDKSIQYNDDKNTFILQDPRVYNKVKLNGIDYKKKINFKIYKKTCKQSESYMMYGTENCRLIDNEIIEKYKDKDLKIIANEGFYDFKIIKLPLKNLFDQFGTYIYTPVPRKFDCSSRLIPECKFYNKKVIYEIDYINEDLGLFYRVKDTQEDFYGLFLNENDDIISILKEHI